jgi:hypothetical protein
MKRSRTFRRRARLTGLRVQRRYVHVARTESPAVPAGCVNAALLFTDHAGASATVPWLEPAEHADPRLS